MVKYVCNQEREVKERYLWNLKTHKKSKKCLTNSQKYGTIKTERNERKVTKMVGIFKYEGGLQIVAVSENEDTAIQALFNKYADDYEKECGTTPREWWEHCRELLSGAPHCFEIREIEVYA